MDQFPPNSRRVVPGSPDAEKKETKNVERITTNDAVRRKTPLSRRFMATFVRGDARQAWLDVISDVLVPAAKDMAADAVTQGFERMIYGETRSKSRRSSFGSGITSRVSYGNYHSPVGRASGLSQRRDEERPISRRSRAAHEFDEIILPTRAEAEEVIDRLFDLVSRYEVATVSDLYSLVGVTGEYTDEKWGWDDIRGASVSRIREGYLLDLPKPRALD